MFYRVYNPVHVSFHHCILSFQLFALVMGKHFLPPVSSPCRPFYQSSPSSLISGNVPPNKRAMRALCVDYRKREFPGRNRDSVAGKTVIRAPGYPTRPSERHSLALIFHFSRSSGVSSFKPAVFMPTLGPLPLNKIGLSLTRLAFVLSALINIATSSEIPEIKLPGSSQTSIMGGAY